MDTKPGDQQTKPGYQETNSGYQGESDQTYEELNKRVSDGELYVISHDPSKRKPVHKVVKEELSIHTNRNQNSPVYGNSSVLKFTGK